MVKKSQGETEKVNLVIVNKYENISNTEELINHTLVYNNAFEKTYTVVLIYPQGIHSELTSGFLKLWIVLTPAMKYVFPIQTDLL